MVRDLTVGSVPKNLLRFALPLFFANVLQSCYNIVDMVVVGRFVGSAGLAAISSAAMLCFLITSVCGGVTMGGTVLIAQYQGAGDREGRQNAIGNLFTLSALIGVLVTGISLLLYRPLLGLMHVPAQAVRYAQSYMQVICLGTVFVFGYNAVCSILRGMGDSKSPLLFVGIATAVNIVLDLLLVGPLRLETRGAALATVVSQAFSFGVAVWYLKRRSAVFDFSFRRFRLTGSVSWTILRVGFPSAVQMAVLNLSYLLVTGMLNVYGVTVAAAAGVGLKVNTFAAMPCWAVGQAVTTMAGQNLGAGSRERTAKTVRAGVLLSLLVTFVTMLAVQLFAPRIVGLFNTDAAVIREGVRYLKICCSVNCLVYAVMYTIDSFATGVGDSMFAMVNSLLHSVVMRLALSVLLGTALGYGAPGIYWAEMLSPVLPFFVGAAYYFSGVWKKRKRLGE